MAAQMDVDVPTKHTVLNSSFPVLLPYDEALFMPEAEFQTYIKSLLGYEGSSSGLEGESCPVPKATGGPDRKRRASVSVDDDDRKTKALFVQGLEQHEAHYRTKEDLASENRGITENHDMTNISSKNSVVDLFYELGAPTTKPDDLRDLLEESWTVDPLLSLKIIFNARSIHLGKSDKATTYRAFGWLAENHPLTLLSNLKWLVRPVIEKKAASASEEEGKKGNNEKEEDFEMISAEDTPALDDPLKAYDVPRGGSHGYWKDLVNIVLFAAHDQLRHDGDPQELLSQHPDNSSKGKKRREWNKEKAKEIRKTKVALQNAVVQNKLTNDPFYRALHLTVARLFSAQLKEDKALLDSGRPSDLKKLSLAAKWAPTFGEFHDKHTFILSAIAEALFPDAATNCPDASNREIYLRHVRENYRKQYGSPLRKALVVVERDIVAQTFENIDYARVPSIAMDRYSRLFMQKDFEHFKGYVQSVAAGKAKISGATLLPSTLVNKAHDVAFAERSYSGHNFNALKDNAEAEIITKIIDGQWNTLVQSVRDAGTLSSSIAICDVSGSMSSPRQKDGTLPLHSAIGLSLLIAEVTAPPFGGGFITFSETPTYISIGGTEDTRDIVHKVKRIDQATWNMNTNFVAVFKDVILPMAVRNGLTQEDMVKQVFVFSDMQFDSAEDPSQRWTSSFERIKQMYEDHGYELPRLIFWNLASLKKGKPVTNEYENTVLVSGYSQGMLKALLSTGALEEEDEEEIEEEEEENQIDPYVQVGLVRRKKKIQPITVVKKAVDHKAYGMLEVVD